MKHLFAVAGAIALVPVAFVVAQTSVEGLRPPSDFAAIENKNARAVALFTEMGKVIQHPRCVNCHPRGDRPHQGNGVAHNPPVARGPDDQGMAGMECATCHGPANVKFATNSGSIPGVPNWHVAPIEMAWEGKTLGQICTQLKDRRRNGGKTLAEIQKHNAEDSLVGWGWDPGAGREPAPGSQRRFGELTQAWIDSGAACPKR